MGFTGYQQRGTEVLTITLCKTSQYFKNRLDLSQNMSSVTDRSSKDTEALADPTVSLPERRHSLSAIFNNVMTLCAMLPLLLFTCLNSFLHQR